MGNDNNRFEDFFFFFLKLLCVCLAAVALYLAYDMYNEKKVDNAIDEVTRIIDDLL